MSSRAILQDTANYTSSPVFQAGQKLFAWPDGETNGQFLPAVLHASPSLPPANAKATPTSGTSGRSSSASSASAALTSCLVSRLRERLGTVGSMEYRQTWREKVTPSGIVYWAHTALARRTSASGCTGWPTPQVHQGPNNSENRGVDYGGARRRITPQNIEDLIAGPLSGWPTPNAIPEGRGGLASNPEAAMRRKEMGHQMNLDDAATLVSGWATPRAEDAESAGMRHGRGVADTLTAQAGQGVSGPTPESSSAETARPAASPLRLNPAFSLWLMGFPVGWFLAGQRVKSRSSRSRGKSQTEPDC